MARSRAMSSTMWRLSPAAGFPPVGTERSRQLPGDAQFGDLPVPDGVLAAVAEARPLGRRIRPADQPARPRPGLAGRQEERLLVFGVRTISQDGGARGFLSAPSCCSQRTAQAANAAISSLSAKLTRLCRV